MAFTLAQTANRDTKGILARYAEYVGRRIPCERGCVSYHLSPLVADRCCGVGFKMMTRFLARFTELMPVLDIMPMVKVG